MKKILVVNTVPFEVNGMSSVILNYFKTMDKSDFQIDFIACGIIFEQYLKEIKTYGSNVYLLKSKKRHPISYLRELTKIIKKNNYDIIHVHGNSALMGLEMYVAKKHNIPVRIAHSHNTTCTFKIIHNLLYRSFIKDCTNRFACGVDAGKWLYRENDFIVLNNGIIIDKYKYDEQIRNEYREKLGIKNERLIGHVGNFVFQKNHNYLVEIFDKVLELNPDFRLILIGEGVLKQEIEKKAKDLGIYDKIIFLGKSQEVNKYLQAIDIIVFPSRFEGLPLTIVEAQTSGVPCLISDKVAKEVQITELVKFIKLEETPVKWAEEIVSYDYESNIKIRNSFSRKIITAGYDIETNAQMLKNMYDQYIRQ